MEVSDILFSRLYQAFFCLSWISEFFTSLVELGRLTKIGQATYDFLLNFSFINGKHDYLFCCDTENDINLALLKNLINLL